MSDLQALIQTVLPSDGGPHVSLESVQAYLEGVRQSHPDLIDPIATGLGEVEGFAQRSETERATWLDGWVRTANGSLIVQLIQEAFLVNPEVWPSLGFEVTA